jgi:hypothetical protein
MQPVIGANLPVTDAMQPVTGTGAPVLGAMQPVVDGRGQSPS